MDLLSATLFLLASYLWRFRATVRSSRAMLGCILLRRRRVRSASPLLAPVHSYQSQARQTGPRRKLRILPKIWRPLLPHLRTLPVAYNARRKRGRTFASAVSQLSETQFEDWPTRGPRTFLWLVQAITSPGCTPVQRRYWWRAVLRLTASDAGVDEHRFLSEVMEQAITFDQINGSECLCLET